MQGEALRSFRSLSAMYTLLAYLLITFSLGLSLPARQRCLDLGHIEDRQERTCQGLILGCMTRNVKVDEQGIKIMRNILVPSTGSPDASVKAVKTNTIRLELLILGDGMA